ncbi:hypothetical protein LR48_Vigan10g277400 [Vigna angularis]|uniref:Uncharacterized protein n=1 Tax=Phaseolus angularis TaxID=3914 RepID=A0A0L9VPQ5_PHAAN|nr:hypothetical protein LR48_Vigan10g277400 [Vigna angularis]
MRVLLPTPYKSPHSRLVAVVVVSLGCRGGVVVVATYSHSSHQVCLASSVASPPFELSQFQSVPFILTKLSSFSSCGCRGGVVVVTLCCLGVFSQFT